MTTYEVRLEQTPWTLNAERASNRWERARRTKQWREAFYYLAKAQKIPRLTKAVIVATPYQKGGRLQDVAACVPAVKAAVDGLVDAGVFKDDSSEFLTAIVFNTPQRGQGALQLMIEGERVNG